MRRETAVKGTVAQARDAAATTRGLIITDANVTTIPAGTAVDNLAAYYNSGAAPITVAGTELSAGAHAVWAWVSGAWVLLSSGTSTPPVDPGDTTAPVWTATLTTGTPAPTSVIVAASALATDDSGTVTYEYSVNEGTDWAAVVPNGLNFTLPNLTPDTLYPAPQLLARDPSGNPSTVLSGQVFTTDALPPPIDPYTDYALNTLAAPHIYPLNGDLTNVGSADGALTQGTVPLTFTASDLGVGPQSAVAVDDARAYTTSPNSAFKGMSSFSLSFVGRPTAWATAPGGSSLFWGFSGSIQMGPFSNTGRLLYKVSTAQYLSGGAHVALNETHAYAITYDGTTVRCYLDGVEMGTAALAGYTFPTPYQEFIADDKFLGELAGLVMHGGVVWTPAQVAALHAARAL